MAIARVRITRNLEQLLSCEAIKDAPPEILERFKSWMGDEIDVQLPPLTKPSGTGTPCSSRFFWRPAGESENIVENNQGCACFCEHMLEMD
jgi:hypothetical protein